ncbi:MAG TPA: class I SAM-dependent methyltransferase [Sphingobium sp.]|nr:class I SAM-dependent methyltransferase [Sphingobium sp.]
MRAVVLLPSIALVACLPAGPEGESQTTTAQSPLRKPDVRYEPSPWPVVHAMLELAAIGPQDVVYDLGSGDGRIPITAARLYGARGIGIDIDPRRIAESVANARKAAVADRVRFRNEDLLEADFRDATVVTLFLSPRLNRELRPRLLRELKPGTRIVSYYHDMGDWKPERRVPAGEAHIYLWTIPAR